MATENERRFLLKKFPNIYASAEVASIEQGYFEIPSASSSFRIRIKGGKQGIIGLKDGEGVSREELEEELESIELSRALFTKTNHQLTKLRIKFDGWEIDIFGGVLTGIILAEYELFEAEDLVIPGWLGEVQEVTNSLTNLHLARLASDVKGTNVHAYPHLLSSLKKIPKIVITGPPCSGKTTVMNRLREIFPDLHFVPEVATIIISQLGLRPGSDELSLNRFQKAIYRTQNIFQSTSTEFAISQGKKAVILDRGTADQPAYMRGGIEQFTHMIGPIVREYENYDAVLFLELPSREVYEANSHNNPARMEKYDEALPLSGRLYNAWNGHPKFFRIKATETWEEKENQIVDVITSITN